MLFDLIESEDILNCPFAPPAIEDDDSGCDVLGIWEEHCIECGAPLCYATCDKFSKTLGGKCRRFKNGIQRVVFRNKAKGYAIHFLEWGKMELVFNGKLTNKKWIRLLCCFECFVAPVVRFTSRFLPFLPWNRNPIALYRSFRRRLLKIIPGRRYTPSLMRVQCYTDNPISLRCSIRARGSEVFTEVFNLVKGWNLLIQNLPKLENGTLVQIFSIDGTSSPVVFSSIDFISDKKKLCASECGAKKRGGFATYVKCVVWDLDNTLWDGILVEDGDDGIKVRNDVIATIKELDRRGILNTICSKNDYDVAWPQLIKFGVDQYFVFPEINWNHKSANIQLIAKNMNIGLDTFAFVDDSAHERAEVMEQLPMIRVLADTEINNILTMDCFNPPISSESTGRRKSYLSEMERRRSAEKFGGSHVDFIRECKIVLLCSPVLNENSIKRCWELVNRTNQLTLAAHRYEMNEFNHLLKDSSIDSYAIHCQDKYGDYGIVGFLAVNINNGMGKLVEFVMSCRVAKKYCEQSVLLSLVERMNVKGIRKIMANVVETGRNGALIEALDSMPFDKTVEEKDGVKLIQYVIDLKNDAWRSEQFYRNAVEWES